MEVAEEKVMSPNGIQEKMISVYLGTDNIELIEVRVMSITCSYRDSLSPFETLSQPSDHQQYWGTYFRSDQVLWINDVCKSQCK